MRISKEKKLNTLFYIGVFMALFMSLGLVVYYLFFVGIGFIDHGWLWSECACTLYGIDSAQAIKEGLYIEGIGGLPVSTSTFPWTKVIGVFIHGSFLDYKSSCIYYVILNLSIFAMTIVLVYKVLKKEIVDSKAALVGIILMLSSCYIVEWISLGNNGNLVCFLTICAICLMEKNEGLAGVLLGIAMIKPQNVLPFYIVFLLTKKWKAIGISASIVITSWIASIIITGVAPWEQLSNLLEMRVELDYSFLVYGIFDSLRGLGVDTKIVLLLSMLLGIIVCTVLTLLFLKRGLDLHRYRFILYTVPAIVSVVWCYKSQCDYNILMIAALGVVEWWYNSEKSYLKLVVSAITIFFLMGRPFWVANVLLGRIASSYTINRIDLYVKMVVALIFIFYCIAEVTKKEEIIKEL